MHPLRVTVKSKGDNRRTVPNTCWAPSKRSVMVASDIVIVILTGGGGVGIVFSASFCLTGELGHLSYEGHCSFCCSVPDPGAIGLLVAFSCNIRPDSSINAPLAGNRML